MLLGEFELPDLYLNMADVVEAALAALGAIAIAGVGGYAAFLIVRRGLRWVSAGSGDLSSRCSVCGGDRRDGHSHSEDPLF